MQQTHVVAIETKYPLLAQDSPGGQITLPVLERWLDQTLGGKLASASAPPNDVSSKAEGLARFGLDRDTLSGLRLGKVQMLHLYRCLYVYSVGF